MITATATGVTIDVRVIPRAAKPGIAGTRDGAVLVRLSAPPVEGAANEELIDVLAKAIGVSKRGVALVSGERSRTKRVSVQGVGVDDVRRKLGIR
jgi:uncharacterized protein (TIGR00251 family)